ncbi:MAG: hypothetical protein Fur0025_48390 [Oscillatoriaceae cyanobacterium]
MTSNAGNSSLQERFLSDFIEKVLWNGRSDNERWCCKLRFHPQNYDQTNTEVAKQINQKLNGSFDPTSMSGTLAAVVAKIKRAFGEQMAADGVDLQELRRERGWKPQKPGDRYPWQVIYQWLWEVEFPRSGWELATNLATCAMKEFKFVAIQERGRDLSLTVIFNGDENIKINQEYALKVHLPGEGYLLLLNRGSKGNYYCLSPSLAFQPKGACLPERPLYLPDPDSDAKAPCLKFEDLGEEYFLAILTEQPLQLSWVRPDGNTDDLWVDEQRFQEIFQQIGRQWNARVFYKRFQVVE